METEGFFIEFPYKNDFEIAEIKLCCQEDNILFYDVYIRNQYQFTVTPQVDDESGITWKISLKNADKIVEQELMDAIVKEIEKHFAPI